MAQTDIPDAGKKIKSRDTDVPWFSTDIDTKLSSSTRELLETYSKIAPEDVKSHILKIRDEAWKIWPYPCIGRFTFLDLAIAQSPYYPSIIQRLKGGNEYLLDLGCCFGQEIRKLVADGAPSAQIYGTDLRPDFFELGYKLFRDKDSLKSTFIAGDIFDPASGLTDLDGKIDIIYAGSFLHLFNRADQVTACKRMAKLLRDRKDSVLMGRQVGSNEPGEYIHRTNKDQTMFRHDKDSFEKMWREVGEATGSKWRVEVQLLDLEEMIAVWKDGIASSDRKSLRLLRFAVFRE